MILSIMVHTEVQNKGNCHSISSLINVSYIEIQKNTLASNSMKYNAILLYQNYLIEKQSVAVGDFHKFLSGM